TAFHPAYSFAGPLRTEIPAQEELTIQLGESKRLNVFVENPDATPCEGARIVVRISATPAGGSSMSLGVPTSKTFTDAEGLAVINNLPDDPSTLVTLAAIHANYTPISKNVTIDELEGGEFVLRFAARRSLGGIVLDPDGNIVPNIKVSLTGPQNQTVNSISDGTFQFNWRKLRPGKYWLQASAAASGVSKRLMVDLAQEAPMLVELVLEPGTGAIAGWVGDAAGQPLGLVPLKLYSGADISIESVSAPSGDFSFDYLPKATYTLRAGDSKRGQAMLDKLLPGTKDIRLTIDRPGSLKGIIESKGPALGFSLRLQERPGPAARSIPARTWKFTSQVARFHLRDLSPGSYDLHVLQRGKVIGKLERITIRPGEETGPVGITGLE
ncbi:MAG: carboxypeptidase-like regulatory domain-containing protein, partial [Planctomycetota bacterium]